jgi:L-threonylcarbamoyladenylate synthase
MQILDLTTSKPATAVERAVEVLRAGGLVVFPTETTYGAGVDATNPSAVQKLLAYKARREGKPLSIAVTDLEMAEQFVVVTEQARQLYHQFLPGPVTVVSTAVANTPLAPGVVSEFNTLGVRIPDYPLVIDIVRALGKPITATSANASDQKRPYAVADILNNTSAKQQSLIDLVLDAGTLPTRPPSTVIDTTLSTPLTLRDGGLSLGSLNLGDSRAITLHSTSQAETKALAGKLVLKHWNAVQDGPLVIGLDGSLGMGKTIFAKGVAEFLGIAETIASPTYTYSEEYSYQRHQTTGTFYHLDLWKVDSAEMLERLEIAQLLTPRSVVVIEWFNQGGEALQSLVAQAQATLLLVQFEQPKADADTSLRTLTLYEYPTAT